MKYRINVNVSVNVYKDTVDGAFNELTKLIDAYEKEGFKLTKVLYGDYVLKQGDKSVILNIRKESDETNN